MIQITNDKINTISYILQMLRLNFFDPFITPHSILLINNPTSYFDKSAEPPQRVRVPLYAQTQGTRTTLVVEPIPQKISAGHKPEQ